VNDIETYSLLNRIAAAAERQADALEALVRQRAMPTPVSLPPGYTPEFGDPYPAHGVPWGPYGGSSATQDNPNAPSTNRRRP
jgi:hypothetical protein